MTQQSMKESRVKIWPPCALNGASVISNMKLAACRVGVILGPFDYAWFYRQVKNSGPWDYKQLGTEFQDFGNFNFGATGFAMGIPPQVLLRSAGWAQSVAGTSTKAWGNWTEEAPYGDDPADQKMIEDGMAFAKQNGY